MTATHTAEIVTFRLKPGADPKAFVTHAQAMMPFLTEAEAFCARVLSCDDDGQWTDHLEWRSLPEAQEAAARMMAHPAAAPFLAQIDPDSVVMRHARIALNTAPG